MTEALLLVNMGGPSSAGEVRNYLRTIFRDPAILPLPDAVRFPLASLISSRRAAGAIERYQQIGGGSPLLHWTQTQRDAVKHAMRADGLDATVEFAFRYTEPTIETALADLHRRGISRVTLLPLFPHYTQAMTGSVVQAAARAAKSCGIELRAVNAWGQHPAILELWRDYLLAAVAEAGDGARVLFVAHGIPERNVRLGENYPCKVMESALKLASSLPTETSWSVAFQSKVGPVKWTQPYLETELSRFCRSPEPLVIMPLSFVADCLETLYDLDIVAAETAHRAGVKNVVRVRAFNDDPDFARALMRVVCEESYASR
jgi:protoporphyrin/coproporphyrin ferrochelatase